MSNEKFMKKVFDRYADKDAVFGDEWFETFIHNAREHGDPAWIDIDWDNHTDSGNCACGDEREMILVLSDKKFSAFWVETSSGGLDGPFAEHDQAVAALGYDPASFPPKESDTAEESKDEDS